MPWPTRPPLFCSGHGSRAKPPWRWRLLANATPSTSIWSRSRTAPSWHKPELYLADHLDQLVILDEVHRTPGLFPVLRGLIDHARRVGHRAGQYLLLGSASLDLLKQSGETLAGRVAYLELTPFHALEVRDQPLDQLWRRGGFPDSLLATDDTRSLRWRQNFIRSYLERDIPQFGPRIAADTLRRFWTMLAHHQGGLLNTAQLARNLGVDTKTAGGYLGLLVDLLLVRRLPPLACQSGQAAGEVIQGVHSRQRHYPRVTRYSGQGNPAGPPGCRRQLGGLRHREPADERRSRRSSPLLSQQRRSGNRPAARLAGRPTLAIEIKRSLTPKAERGFHSACADLKPEKRWVVYPGIERYRLAEDIEAVPLILLAQALRDSWSPPLVAD